jgi:excisionase family DNA binding protein
MENLNEVFSFENNRLLTTKQAAHYLGFSVGHIYNLVYMGELVPLKCGKKPKSSLRFSKRDLDEFLGRQVYDNKKAR